MSSAAVLGIVLFAGRLAGAFERAMPHGIAEMMAMTVAAQLFTLPIQVLMEPELPLLSVPANLLVSPFVGLATMAGLMALACAWCEPWLAGVFAWISSWGTLVMERVASWLGGSTMAVIPWKDGVTGAVLIVAVEIGIGMLLVCSSAVASSMSVVMRPECLACASVPLGMSASVSGARRRDVSLRGGKPNSQCGIRCSNHRNSQPNLCDRPRGINHQPAKLRYS